MVRASLAKRIWALSTTYSAIVTIGGVFAAAMLRGFTGFGFGLAAVPLLSLALPPASVVPLVVTLQVIIGLSGLRAAARLCDWRAVGTLTPGLVLGVPAGLMLLTSLPSNRVRLAIGLVIAGSVGLLHRGARLPPQPPRLIALAVGFASGIINGLASMGGPPIIVYLLAAGHSPVRLRATSIVYFMLASLVSLVPMLWSGLINRQTLFWAVLVLPGLFAGSWFGSLAFRRARPAHHRLVALVTLSVLAVLLIGRALLRDVG
jgi:uncharacterized membrane protein YfcA